MMPEVQNSMPRERVGPYRLVRLLGKGGMGAVYEAIQEPIERRVAIKILHGRYAQEPEIAARFFNEARAVNIVDHPGIVQISDYGQLPSGVAYLVMEYLKGETLTQRIKRSSGGRLQQPEALRLGRQIAAALAAAHEKSIIHRDLKPDNVMLIVDPDPEAMGRVRAKLLDFGIAKVAAEVGKEGAANTAADVVMGTPKYMSPEQCRGAANVDDKSDVYALGIMLYEMLAGRVPFLGPTGDVLAKQIYEEPPQLSQFAPTVTPDVVALVHRLLKKNKAERPTMRQVTAELERMCAHFPTMAHPILPPPPPPAAEKTDSSDRVSMDSVVEEQQVEAVTNPPVSVGGAGAEADSQPGLQRQSTLGFSVGQSNLSMRPPSRLRRFLLPAGAALAVIGALVAAVSLRMHNPALAPPPPAVKGPPKKIFWSLSSTPAGAEIVRVSDGQRLGTTPWHGEQERGQDDVAVRLKLDGYIERTLTLHASDDDHREVTLEPAQPAQPLLSGQPSKPASATSSRVRRPATGRVSTSKTTALPHGRPKIVD